MLGPGTDLFDFMAEKLLEFLRDHNLLGGGREFHLGFTFSFPTREYTQDFKDVDWKAGRVMDKRTYNP